MGVVQIAMRKPDVSEHVVVAVRKARELTATSDCRDEEPGASRQCRGGGPD
jgi:hypothetical protein